ncbi:hypothetical protein [Actinomadura sp. RB99]|nr:hypothetical protein [Actinomadura sp. RB99]
MPTRGIRDLTRPRPERPPAARLACKETKATAWLWTSGPGSG